MIPFRRLRMSGINRIILSSRRTYEYKLCGIEPLCDVEIISMELLPSVVPTLHFDPPANQITRRAKTWLQARSLAKIHRNGQKRERGLRHHKL